MIRRADSGWVSSVKLRFWRFDLKLAHRWAIASGLGPGGGGGTDVFKVAFVELNDQGLFGLGESAPSTRYQESVDTTIAFLEKVDPQRLSFADVPGSMAYLDTIAAKNFAPKGALNIALMDGAARLAGKPVYDFLDLGFRENVHVTSFSIGLDSPEMIRKKSKKPKIIQSSNSKWDHRTTRRIWAPCAR